jgi:hypothetical protein
MCDSSCEPYLIWHIPRPLAIPLGGLGINYSCLLAKYSAQPAKAVRQTINVQSIIAVAAASVITSSPKARSTYPPSPE